jgi:DNA-binding NarL/FixJ family response regulator
VPVTIRIVVGEDSYLLREGIARTITDAPGFELVGSCTDLDSLRTTVEDLRPDVVLTGIRLPPTNTDEGIRLAAELRTGRPDIGVVVLGQGPSSTHAAELLAGGASRRGYVLTDRIAAPEDLVDILRKVADGGSHLDQGVINAVFDGWDREAENRMKTLTPRELEVLKRVAAGDTNAAIAERLEIGTRAVERHVNSIFAKLDLGDPERVSRRVKAALAYVASASL